MPQRMVTCRACQRVFLVSAEDLDRVEATCPLCGLTIASPPRTSQPSIPPTEVTPWDPSWSDCG